MRTTQQKRFRIFRPLPIIVAVLVVAAGVGGVIWRQHYLAGKKVAAKVHASVPISQDKIHPGTSEGSTFPVPDNVPQNAVVNYQLVVDNEQYKIRKDSGSQSYIITLYAIINHPDQYNDYKQQLADYKQNALTYLKNQGVDITKATITYEPSEAKDL